MHWKRICEWRINFVIKSRIKCDNSWSLTRCVCMCEFACPENINKRQNKIRIANRFEWAEQKKKKINERSQSEVYFYILPISIRRRLLCSCGCVCEQQVFDRRLQRRLLCLTCCACVSACDLVRMQVRWRRFILWVICNLLFIAHFNQATENSQLTKREREQREIVENLGYCLAKEKEETIQVSTE